MYLGNAASIHFQPDVYGKLMDLPHLARSENLEPEAREWQIEMVFLKFLEAKWKKAGLWQVGNSRYTASLHTL